MKNWIYLLLTLATFSSCHKQIHPQHEDGKSANTLITGAYVLLFRDAKFNTSSKAPLLEQTLFGELALRPRNTVTVAVPTAWNQAVGGATFQGNWLAVFSDQFFPANDPQHHFVLARFFFPMFKAKEHLLTVLAEFVNAITPAQKAEVYYLLGLVHYYQHYMFGSGTAYNTQSDLAPAIDYFERGLALAARPYKDNKIVNDLGAQAFLARLYYLDRREAQAMALAQELRAHASYAAADELLWRVSMTDDNMQTTTFTGAINLWGANAQSIWNIAWAATGQTPESEIFEGALSTADPTVRFYALKQENRWQRATLPHVQRANGFMIITKEEVDYLAEGRDLSEEDFRRRHVFNALLNRAVAIKTANCGAENVPNCGVHYIAPYLKP